MAVLALLKAIGLALSIGLALFMPLVLDGISRKVKARIQWRMGPPILQTVYDIAKLLRMRSVVPTDRRVFVLAPYIAFASALSATTTLPIGNVQPVSFTGDIFVFLYVLAMVSVSMMMAGFSVTNAFANIGANREMMLILSIEPVLGVGIGILALLTSSLSMLSIMVGIAKLPLHELLFAVAAYALLGYAVYVESGFIPFDIAEAETEILEGSLCEYSGRLLAMFKWGLLMKRFALVWLYSSLIVEPLMSIPSLDPCSHFVSTLLLQIAMAFVIYVLISVGEALNARYRVDHVISMNTKAFFASLAVLALTAVVVYG